MSKFIWGSIFSLLLVACKKDDISAGNDPNFTIVSHHDEGFKKFNRKVVVFGIPIYAVKKVEDSKLLHAANVLAQYLDNNEDSIVDNLQVLDAMLSNNAFLFLWKKSSDVNKVNPPDGYEGQDLGNDETVPDWHKNGHTGRFDATIEEVWHLVTHTGYASAYPNIFGEMDGTSLCNAMDIARGGKFTTIPNPYPQSAWYTYDDKSCDYSCMAAEYIYWAMSSILGAQENRLDEIEQEWKLNTLNLVQNNDSTIFNLLSDPQYHFPTNLPDGTYRH